MSDSMPNVTPYLYYRDAPAAIDFLERAFGFETVARYPDERGGVAHCDCASGTALVMLGSNAMPPMARSPVASPCTSRMCSRTMTAPWQRAPRSRRRSKRRTTAAVVTLRRTPRATIGASAHSPGAGPVTAATPHVTASSSPTEPPTPLSSTSALSVPRSATASPTMPAASATRRSPSATRRSSSPTSGSNSASIRR